MSAFVKQTGKHRVLMNWGEKRENNQDTKINTKVKKNKQQKEQNYEQNNLNKTGEETQVLWKSST